MPRPSDKDRVRRWLSRTISADKAYKKWANRFDVDFLERLYIGEHHDVEGPYTINLCFPSVETRLSMMTVDRPYFRIEAKPQRADDQGTNIEARAKLREDTLNCFIADERVGFMEATALGVKEAHYRFAVVEVVYSNDFIDNPNADKPVLIDGQEAGKQPSKVPNPQNDSPHEYVKIKRIPPQQFRVSVNPKNNVEECDWVGYFEWHPVEDLKRNPNYKNTHSLKATGKYRDEYSDPTPGPAESNPSKAGLVRLWKIWDLRTKKRLVFVDEGEKFLLEESFDIFPFAILKFHELSDEFYPLPPMFNWRDPQKELNETRDMQKTHRKRMFRRYIYRDGAIEELELEKLERGGDGVYAKVNGPLGEVIGPVPDAPLDNAVWRNIPATKEDFIQISAVSGEQRGVSDAETATQASIVDVNAKRREVKDATKVAQWMSKIAQILLETIEKRMALPFWVKTNVDPTGPNAVVEAAGVIATWKEITSGQLGDDAYEITVDVESLSPMNEREDQARWGNVLSLLGNPPAMAALSKSRLLVRKVLGFKSDRDIQEVQGAFQATLQTMQQMAQQQKGGQEQGPEGLMQMLQGVMQGQ